MRYPPPGLNQIIFCKPIRHDFIEQTVSSLLYQSNQRSFHTINKMKALSTSYPSSDFDRQSSRPINIVNLPQSGQLKVSFSAHSMSTLADADGNSAQSSPCTARTPVSPTTTGPLSSDFLARFAAMRDHSVKRPEPEVTSPISQSILPLDKITLPSLVPSKPNAVLVACGSYSPITHMHLWLFEMAKNYLMHECQTFDIIGGFISPVHDLYGKPSLVEAKHRVSMIDLAVEDSSWLSCSKWEVNQSAWCRTAATLQTYNIALNAQLRSSESDPPIHTLLLCGADLLESTLIPNLWAPADLDLILGKFGVAVIERVGLDLEALIDASPQLKQYRSNIHIVPQRIVNNVSSTSVRHLIKQGQSIKYLVPDKVMNYIYQNELFGHDAARAAQRQPQRARHFAFNSSLSKPLSNNFKAHPPIAEERTDFSHYMSRSGPIIS